MGDGVRLSFHKFSANLRELPMRRSLIILAIKGFPSRRREERLLGLVNVLTCVAVTKSSLFTDLIKNFISIEEQYL